MTQNEDYPRMMFHRSSLLVVVNSREEEDELGPAWRRTVWPAEAAPPAEPIPEPPTASAVPEPMCWHKRIGDDGICLDCGKRAAIQLSEPLDAPPDETSAFEPAPKKPARKRR